MIIPPRTGERSRSLRASFYRHKMDGNRFARKTTIVARFLIAAVVVFGASIVHQNASKAQQQDVCGPNKTIVGSLEHRTLCFDPSKQTLKTIRYKIDRFGTDADLSPLTTLLGDLAAVSKMRFNPDEIEPNFLVILVISGSPIAVKKVIASLDLVGKDNQAVELTTMLEQFRRDVEMRATDWESGHLIVHRRDGGVIYVVARVQRAPIKPLFLALDLRENMMDALGLSFAMRPLRN